jgi:hypothetical protein
MSKSNEPEIIEGQTEISSGETVVSELVGDETADPSETRKVRIYDRARGDFLLDIPRRSTVTFGYFNPAAPRYSAQDGGYGRNRPSDVAAATALRIYETGPKSSQLACFLDVQGFRDLSLRLTRLRQRVTIESNFEDDGDGGIESAFKQHKALNPVTEDDELPF